MRIVDGKLALETAPCWHCNETGKVEETKLCPRLRKPQNGTACPHCGSRRQDGHNYCLPTGRIITCTRCNGTGQEPETTTDHLPVELWKAFRFVVYRQDRPASWNESHLGMGCCWSCTDYGRTWQANNSDAAIAEVRDSRTSAPQACKVFQEDGTPADHIGIFVSQGGYSVRAVWDLPTVQAEIASEPDETAGRMIGRHVAELGGHGTIAAAGKY